MKIFNIYWWERVLDLPFKFYRETKWFIQRGKRGWADCDAWSIDDYLAEILPPMLKRLQTGSHGIPGWSNDEDEEVAQERWNKTMEDIIFAWESQEKICNTDWLYYTGKERIQAEKHFKNDSGTHVMTKEECEKYRLGMKNFIKYLNCLWD